ASQVEQHGTRMARLLVGAAGPGGARGLAPGARVLPIRVLGWQPTGTGQQAVFGWADQLLAGLERAVDPDQDGAVTDAVPIALAPVVEPFAAFADSPEARAVAGATALGTLVVAAGGNDGPAEAGSGTVGAPASARAALAVGAVDGRPELGRVAVQVITGGTTIVDGEFNLLGRQSVARTVTWDLTTLHGASLAEPTRERGRLATGETLTDFYATDGVSRVSQTAVVVPAAQGYLGTVAKNARAAGAAVLLVYGDELEPGSIDLSEERAAPVVALPREMGRAIATIVARGDEVSVTLEPAAPIENEAAPRIAPFSSRGLSFDGVLRPDLVAPGVGLATADARPAPGADAPYATVTGSSASAAVVAGAAALLAQQRPELKADELKAALVASTTPLASATERAAVSGQGGGVVDVSAALETTLIADPPVVALGAPTRGGWTSEVLLELHNLGAEDEQVTFALIPDGGEPLPLEFRVDPSSLNVAAGTSESVRLVVSLRESDVEWEGWISGSILVQPAEGPATRVPFATAFAEDPPAPLVDAPLLTPVEGTSDAGLLSVLSFRVGWVGESPAGLALGPVSLLEVELWRGTEFVGTIARLRDLLPGRYSIGLTGRAPDGAPLAPGQYRLQFVARPAIGGFGELVRVSGPSFQMSPGQQEGQFAWAGRYFGPGERDLFEEWLLDRGTSYGRWSAAHPSAACATFSDC
ncbi:MAG: S8 family serine peptidase, partial [Gaiellaceae bacterium]